MSGRPTRPQAALAVLLAPGVVLHVTNSSMRGLTDEADAPSLATGFPGAVVAGLPAAVPDRLVLRDSGQSEPDHPGDGGRVLHVVG
jgi:hypothetical protein